MNKRWELKRIGLWSAVKIGGTVSAVLGFILGIVWGVVMAFFSSLMGTVFSMNTAGIGFSWLVVLPLLFTCIYGFLGIIFSFLFALLYNLASGILGGVQLEMDDERKKAYDGIYGEL